MARIRTIKPEFWTDEKLAPLSPICRLTFLGLVSMADDAGRLNDSVKLLDGLLFSETDDSVGDSLNELESLGVIQRGSTSNGKRVIQIVGWLKHQKIEKANLKSALPEIDQRQVGETSGKRRNLPKDVRDAILQHDDYKCCECGIDVIPEKQDRYDSRDNLAEIDHVIALADGGSDEPENMRTLCKKCNRRKQGLELAQRNRRQFAESSTTSRGEVGDISPPGSTIYDLRSTTDDLRPGSRSKRARSEVQIPNELSEAWAKWVAYILESQGKSIGAIEAEATLKSLLDRGVGKAIRDIEFSIVKRCKTIRDSDNDYDKPKSGPKTFAAQRVENTKKAIEEFANDE